MTLIQTFHGTASNGTPLTAVYAEQPAAAAAFALVFPGSDLPRLHRMAERAADTVRSVVRL